jgi:hypothetical protein
LHRPTGNAGTPEPALPCGTIYNHPPNSLGTRESSLLPAATYELRGLGYPYLVSHLPQSLLGCRGNFHFENLAPFDPEILEDFFYSLRVGTVPLAPPFALLKVEQCHLPVGPDILRNFTPSGFQQNSVHRGFMVYRQVFWHLILLRLAHFYGTVNESVAEITFVEKCAKFGRVSRLPPLPSTNGPFDIVVTSFMVPTNRPPPFSLSFHDFPAR